MKDVPLKPSQISLMPKTKVGIKKEKIAKKMKDQKLTAPKSNKGKNNSVKNAENKTKSSKEGKEAVPKRKRGRPRNDDKVPNSKKTKNQVKGNNKNDVKSVGRKRKIPQTVIKIEKDFSIPPQKKPKILDINYNASMNGNSKIPPALLSGKPWIQKGESPTAIEHTVSNSMNGNGTFNTSKKSLPFGTKKPGSILKSATFIPPPSPLIQPPAIPKKEMVNGNSWLKPLKVSPFKTTKPVIKKEIEIPKDIIKNIKVEKVNNVFASFKEPVKSHPQRMASLDAMAKMHVICTTDRRPIEHHPKTSSVVTICSQPFVSEKSLTQCHKRIQFDLKKESKDFEGSIVHKQINYVKEKQEVIVSHSVEQSSILEREKLKNSNFKSEEECVKKKKPKSSLKCLSDNSESIKSVKFKPNSSIQEKNNTKSDKTKSKTSKNKDTDKKTDKKTVKVQNKGILKTTKKTPKEKQGSNSKKLKKIEQTKSEVKVKETIRMQKTCTYQSVTTVNTHGTNSSVVPVSHVGMTTNISKTKKTVVTDEECKNKINYSSGTVMNNSYCLTSDSPCTMGHHRDCCNLHTHAQIIPIAHVQTCSIGHGVNRTSDSSSSSSHCEGSFPVHRFGHQQSIIYSSPTIDYGCCCSGSLMQNVHDTCLVRKKIVAYSHHFPHHNHLSNSTFGSDGLCTDYHPGNPTFDATKHHAPHFGLSPPPHSRVSCCSCSELHRDSNQHHPQSTGSCLQFLSSPKSSASLVPCEQSPLDLSLASAAASNSSADSDIPFQPGQCPSPLCCRDLLLLRTSAPHGCQTNQFPVRKACCKCDQSICGNAMRCSGKCVNRLDQPSKSANHVGLLTSVVSQGSVLPIVSASTVTTKNVPQITTDNLVTTKKEKIVSPKQSSKLAASKKRQFEHGWSWKGRPREKLICLTNDSAPCMRLCYPSVQHKEGDTISERDCVLLRSGPKDTDLPYVAKIATFWENPDDGEMMMSLLWYYRPEHTEQGRKPGQMEDEVFASRHKDANSVACIEDKCYVLTYNEYCRYRASLTMEEDTISKASMLVPELADGYPRKERLPSDAVASDIVFFCRHVYDFRTKRILKNPSSNT
ncbi:uncharacterized protein LOC129223961 [Uloborus diversus]|uniref:uncharacterized protein LOC129223961 n=1 Tax=Uloborus diversus TaxID=327109 RepID=UPI00240932AC|nr:uncharacterized protein LOC129223961 [Uloborus diversus]